MVIQITLHHGSDGYIVARCPSLKSCWSQGRTREEAIENIKEAIALYLEPSPKSLAAAELDEVVELSL